MCNIVTFGWRRTSQLRPKTYKPKKFESKKKTKTQFTARLKKEKEEKRMKKIWGCLQHMSQKKGSFSFYILKYVYICMFTYVTYMLYIYVVYKQFTTIKNNE